MRANVTVQPNPNEVMDYKFVTPAELRALLADADAADAAASVHLTPWFRLIAHSHLFGWWDALAAGQPLPHDDTIHRML